MKKLLFSAALIVAIGFASCKKDYSCSCTVKDSSGTTTTVPSGTFHATKKKAKDACDAVATTANSSGTGSTWTCTVQ